MKTKIGLIALGLSIALLSGCSSSDSVVDSVVDPIVDPVVDPVVNLNTPAEVEKNLVGIWNTGCVVDGDSSATDNLSLNADGTGTYASTEYSSPDCNPANEVDSDNGNFTYKVGEATQGSDGRESVEIDIVLTDLGNEDYYTMIYFATVDSLQMASSNDGDINDGGTPETRENLFFEDWIHTRQ